jgi:hypothetical protein
MVVERAAEDLPHRHEQKDNETEEDPDEGEPEDGGERREVRRIVEDERILEPAEEIGDLIRLEPPDVERVGDEDGDHDEVHAEGPGGDALARAIAAEPAPKEADDEHEVPEVGEDADLGSEPSDQRELEVQDERADEKDLDVPADGP